MDDCIFVPPPPYTPALPDHKVLVTCLSIPRGKVWFVPVQRISKELINVKIAFIYITLCFSLLYLVKRNPVVFHADFTSESDRPDLNLTSDLTPRRTLGPQAATPDTTDTGTRQTACRLWRGPRLLTSEQKSEGCRGPTPEGCRKGYRRSPPPLRAARVAPGGPGGTC